MLRSLALPLLLTLGVTVAVDSVPVDPRPLPLPAVRTEPAALPPVSPIELPFDGPDPRGLRASGAGSLLYGVGFTRFGYYDTTTGAALPGSTWTFDHGAPDPFEGWVARDGTANSFTAFRFVDNASWTLHNPSWVGPPPDPVLTGAGSVWLGLFEDEAACAGWVGTRGYGNNWSQRFYSDPFTNASGLPVNVSFNYFVDTESGFDVVNVTVVNALTLGSPIAVTSFTGQSGSPAAPTPFSQGVITGIGTFRLMFTFTSDGGWSDADGNNPTTIGPFGLDDVVLTNVTYSGPWTFETGLQGWTAEPVPGIGTFASVVANGFSIPDPLCTLESNVVALYDTTDTMHVIGQAERLISPPVPLTSFAASRNIFARVNLYLDLPLAEGIFYQWAFSHYPDACGNFWSSPAGPATLFYSPSTTCLSTRFWATGAGGSGLWVPTGVDSVRFIFTVVNNSGVKSGSYGPLLDNIWIGVSSAAVLHVPSPSYPTIQSAINAASPGDTVLVAPGIYTGQGNCGIDFGGTDLVLMSEGGPQVTIVDCMEGSRNLIFQSGETAAAVVDGFTFTGGDSTVAGSSIRIGPTPSSPTIRNCVVTGNAAQSPGGGILLVEAGVPSFVDCAVASNRASPEIVLVAGGGPGFTRCLVVQNEGTGFVTEATDVTCTDCTFSLNTVGGVHLRGSPAPVPSRAESCLVQPTFTGCVISGNVTTASGGGILIDPQTFCLYTPLFASCVITGNSASGNGGGVALLGTVWDGATAPRFESCTVAGNSAGMSGGAFYVGAYDAAGLGQGSITAEGAIIWDNCAGDFGGQGMVETTNELAVLCSLADTTLGYEGEGTITYTDVSSFPPGFCKSVLCDQAPTAGGDFHLSADSPGLPDKAGNPCGVLVGALDTECPEATPGPVTEVRPERTRLYACSPSPFRTTTAIRFDLARPGPVTVRVYDVAGRRVRTVTDGFRPAAGHRAVWDGRDERGRAAAAGVYFVRLVAGEVRATRRVILLR